MTDTAFNGLASHDPAVWAWAAGAGVGEDVVAIIRRAAPMGIPAWRIAAALGLPLPAATADR